MYEAHQIVVMVAPIQYLRPETGFGGRPDQCAGINVKPVEGQPFRVAIFHAEIHFTIVTVGGVVVHIAVLVLKHVAEVGGVGNDAAAGDQQAGGTAEEVAETPKGAPPAPTRS